MKERIVLIGTILLVFAGCSFFTFLLLAADSMGTHMFFVSPDGAELLLVFAFVAMIGLAPAVAYAFTVRPSLLDSYSVRRFLRYFAVVMLISAGTIFLSSVTIFRYRIVLQNPNVPWGVTLAIPFLVLAVTAWYVLSMQRRSNKESAEQ